MDLCRLDANRLGDAAQTDLTFYHNFYPYPKGYQCPIVHLCADVVSLTGKQLFRIQYSLTH